LRFWERLSFDRRQQSFEGLLLTAPIAKRGDQAKIMIGHSIGSPIVLAPPNDLLGMAITEGIEDALTVHEHTRLGAWAAGSASRLPAIADVIPAYIEVVTISVDDDIDGRRHAAVLGDRVQARGIEVRWVLPNRWRAAS
jgi:Toprim domain